MPYSQYTFSLELDNLPINALISEMGLTSKEEPSPTTSPEPTTPEEEPSPTTSPEPTTPEEDSTLVCLDILTIGVSDTPIKFPNLS